MSGGEVFFDNVGAGDVGGHQVRRELDAFERQPQRLRNGAHHQRLGGAGQAGDQAMAADKQRGQNLVQHLLLADDYLAHLGENAITHRIKAFDALLQLAASWLSSGIVTIGTFSCSISSFLTVLLFRVFDLQQQFLRRAIPGRSLQRSEHAFLGLVALS